MQTLFSIVWTVIVTFFFSIATIICSLLDPKSEIPHKIARLWAGFILAGSCIKVEVKGLSNIDMTESYIYMANHQSNFDIPVLLASLPVQFKWLAKAELFRIPLFGYAMRRLGYISIDRSGRRSALASLKKVAKTIKNGVSVIIFPEGTRSRDGNIKPFKNGGFVIAIDAGVPIVPVIIHGTWPIMSKNRLHIKPGNVILEIQKPIESSFYTRKTKNDLLKKVRKVICESYEKGKQDSLPC